MLRSRRGGGDQVDQVVVTYAEVVRGVCQLVEEWVRGGEPPEPCERVAVKRRDGVRIEGIGGGVVLPVGKGDADRG